MYVKFWGVRGSVPVPGKDTIHFGGNTTCVEIRTKEGDLIIVDAGTGIRLLGLELLKGDCGKGRGNLHILFTHTHWDHIQGFPFFMPAYVGQKDVSGQRLESTCNMLNLYGASDVDDRLEATLRGQMEHFYFPVDLGYLNASIKFHPMQGKSIKIGNSTIHAKRLIHPNGVLGYRIEDEGKVFVIATDCEHPSDGTLDQNIMELAKDADVFVYDTLSGGAGYATQAGAVFPAVPHSDAVFAAPGASGCGPLGALNWAVNLRGGVPAASGKNSLTTSSDVYAVAARKVRPPA